MLIRNKRIKFKKSYKKHQINKFWNAKLLYKLQYRPEFLSKVKKIVDDVKVYQSNLLLHNEKMPIQNKYTNKFVFSNSIIGKSLNNKIPYNKIFQNLETGRLSLVNKNPVLNPKLSKFIITTKRAITRLEQGKKAIIFKYLFFYKVFEELTYELFVIKKLRRKRANSSLVRYPFFKFLRNKKKRFQKLIRTRVIKKLRISYKKRRLTASQLLRKKTIRKLLNNLKKQLEKDFVTKIKKALGNRNNVNKHEFNLTLAQMIICNVYLGNNSAYISSAIKPFLLGRRNGFYIINLSFTYLQFKILINLIIGIVSKRGKILIVNEKDLFNLNLVLNYKRIFYCDKGWIGGALTNHRIVRLCDKFNQRNYAINTLLTMKTMPSLMFLLDPNLSISAMFEGYNLHIPISAIVNTDCLSFESINYPIIGNNQAFECVYLYIHILKNAIKLGIQKEYRKILQII